MKNNPSRSVSGFCGLQGVSKGIFQMGSGKQTLAEFNSREDVAWIPGGKIKKGHGRLDQYFTAGTSVTGDLSLVCRLLGVSLCVSYCRSARFLGCCFSLPWRSRGLWELILQWWYSSITCARSLLTWTHSYLSLKEIPGKEGCFVSEAWWVTHSKHIACKIQTASF